jgi:hypothetical protein
MKIVLLQIQNEKKNNIKYLSSCLIKMHFQSVQMKQTPPAQGIFLLIFTVHGMRWIRQQGQKTDEATGQEMDQAAVTGDGSGSRNRRWIKQ